MTIFSKQANRGFEKYVSIHLVSPSYLLPSIGYALDLSVSVNVNCFIDGELRRFS